MLLGRRLQTRLPKTSQFLKLVWPPSGPLTHHGRGNRMRPASNFSRRQAAHTLQLLRADRAGIHTRKLSSDSLGSSSATALLRGEDSDGSTLTELGAPGTNQRTSCETYGQRTSNFRGGPDPDRAETAYVVWACLAALVVTLCVTFFLVFTFLSKGKLNDDDSSILNENSRAGGHPLPTSIIVPFPVKRSTTSLPQRPVASNALVCVVHEDFNRTSLAFPPDGLCDLMFFDSLLTKGGNRLAPPYQENFQYFLDTAQQHSSTEYGVGFDYSSIINAAASTVSSDEKEHLEYIWENRVYHYGSINSPMRSLTMTNLLALLNKLMEIADLMEDKKSLTRPIYKAIFLAIQKDTPVKAIAEAVRAASVTIVCDVTSGSDCAARAHKYFKRIIGRRPSLGSSGGSLGTSLIPTFLLIADTIVDTHVKLVLVATSFALFRKGGVGHNRL
ncbi:hypothetical protein MRX96_037971 [Rhipicephalus microplus]